MGQQQSSLKVSAKLNDEVSYMLQLIHYLHSKLIRPTDGIGIREVHKRVYESTQ
jgi:hypothetical protein